MDKKFNLDLKDRRILHELDHDARIPFSKIAKKIGLSTEVVHYRVKRLEEKGVITKYQTTIDYSALGVQHFKICVKYNGIDLKTEESIYDELSGIPQVIWIAKCVGEYDSIFSCNANNIRELDEVKDKILSVLHLHVSKKSISLISNIWYFSRNYFLDEVIPKAEYSMRYNVVETDDIDLRILRVLSENAREPVISISEKVGLSSKNVIYRIKKLKDLGVINKFRLVIDYSKLNLNFFKTFFYLKNPEKKRFSKLLAVLKNHPNVIIIPKVVGDWDLEPEFEFESKEDFQNLIQEIKNEFSDIIQDITVIDIVKEYKYTFFHK